MMRPAGNSFVRIPHYTSIDPTIATDSAYSASADTKRAWGQQIRASWSPPDGDAACGATAPAFWRPRRGHRSETTRRARDNTSHLSLEEAPC
jgi:hypothetical protein